MIAPTPVASLSASLAMKSAGVDRVIPAETAVFDGQTLSCWSWTNSEIFRYQQKNVGKPGVHQPAVAALCHRRDVPIYVVITMRSDFLGNLVAFFRTAEAVNRGIYLTPRLGPDQLKSIIATRIAGWLEQSWSIQGAGRTAHHGARAAACGTGPAGGARLY